MSSPKSPAQTQDLFPIEKQYQQIGCDVVLSNKWDHFPELTIEQNRVIWEAREKGWDISNVPADTAANICIVAYHFLKGAK